MSNDVISKRLTLSCMYTSHNTSVGEASTCGIKGDKVTDCPGKPLALSSHCIVGNAARQRPQESENDFFFSTVGAAVAVGVINKKVNVGRY